MMRSAGMAMRSAEAARSERMTMCDPSSMTFSTSAQTVWMADFSPVAPWLAGHVVSMVRLLKLNSSMCLTRSSSCSSRMADSSASTRACLGVSSSRFFSAPRPADSDMTAHSRMGSMGGFVTCAKSCLK